MGLETLSNGIRLEAEHIESGVIDYGQTLTVPPSNAYDDIDVIQIDGSSPSKYSVRFRLFTEEEGHSDLELQPTFLDENTTAETMRFEIDGILVA